MKKYIFYTLILIALFLGISATTSFADETGDLTLKFKTEDGYGIYDSFPIVYEIELTKDGETLTGFTIEKSANVNCKFSSLTNKQIYFYLLNFDANNTDEATITIKDIPVGTSYRVLTRDKQNVTGNIDLPSVVQYYTTDKENGTISKSESIINYTLKPKQTKIVVTYNDLLPDYKTPELRFDLTLHKFSMFPDKLHYYYESNPNEVFEMDNRGTDSYKDKIPLERGDSFVITDAPLGIQFLITPSYNNDIDAPFEVRYDDTTSSQICSDELHYFYRVTYQQYMPLTISKMPSLLGVDMTKEFTFKITAEAANINFAPFNSTYLYEVIDIDTGDVVETRETKFTDGVAYVKCKANQKIKMGDIIKYEDVQTYNGNTFKKDVANKFINYTRLSVEEVDYEGYTPSTTRTNLSFCSMGNRHIKPTCF